jgi:hypothetical protein
MTTYQKFWRDTPYACHRVSFKGQYMHYVSLEDGVDFKNFPANVASGQSPRDFLFKSLVTRIRKHVGADFFLNEYVHATEKPIDHCLFLDIDLPNFSALDDIRTALEELVNGQLILKVSVNEESKKVHIVTNILIDSTEQKTLTKFLEHYLYQFIEHEYTQEQWNKGFDDKACGLRSIYSIKIKSAIESRARYIPISEPEPTTDDEFADLLWKYSIYNTENAVHLSEDACEQVAAFMVNNARAYVAPPDEELINKTQTLPIFGRDHKVDQALLDKLIQCLVPEWKNDRRW